MISELQISNFKCFRRSPIFSFSKVNLLTGLNGRGKSTVLQVLLVLSQSADRLRGLPELKLNGRHVQLGNFQDIKNSDTPRSESITFQITYESPQLKAIASFKENEADQLVAQVDSIAVEFPGVEELGPLMGKVESILESVSVPKGELDIEIDLAKYAWAGLLSKIHYIGADRLGPVKYVEKVSLPQPLSVGPSGEYLINILGADNLPLVHERLYRGKDANTVVQQTQEWLNYILDGARIDIKGKELDSSVLYMLLNNRHTSNGYKPSNVGFGYSYALPLVVSGLIAKEGDVLIVENPEAHLHPRAQSRITEFFAIVASCGVQVFIESHSEHILNGLRVSSLNPKIGIQPADLSIQYFNESFDPIKLSVSDQGKIEDWPDGFFDQQELDLASLFRLSH